ncbi:MAG: SpoIID/LytB domain-containing protein [Planctomycetaceae bacterium]|nr:SpoIID/LytB domain-containing protein [Planctomycetaceae bacterium]
MSPRTFATVGLSLIAVTLVTAAVLMCYRPRGGRPDLEVPIVSRRDRAQSSPPTRPPARDVYSPPVRVVVTPQPARSVKLSIDGPYEVRPIGSSRVLARGSRLDAVEVVATSSGFQWGKTSLAVARVEIHPERSPSIWVDDHQYRGSLRLFRKTDGRLNAVNVVPLEEYVASVVDGEMPAAFPEEARKTQAILARTYALFRTAEAAGHPEFDVYSTTRSQKYLGFQYRTDDGRRLAGESASSRKATSDTAGIVCTADGRVFSTYYCAACGGATIDGDRVFSDAAPVIRGVTCRHCDASDFYRWTTRSTKANASESLRNYFKSKGERFDKLSSIARLAGADEGPSHPFEVKDGRVTRMVAAVDLRRMMPPSTLPSPFFDVRSEGDALVFSGRGHGHGVGVCQWGARGLALKGADCYQILRHYYPGVGFVAVAPPATKSP